MKMISLALVLLASSHFTHSALNDKQKQILLNMHNDLRSQLALGKIPKQPAAANMNVMRWSDESATKAQKWADQCIYNHDKADNRKYGKFDYIGQNAAASSYVNDENGSEIRNLVNMWWDEYKSYTYASKSCNKICTHYTQMAWAKSVELGCGVAHCSGKWFKTLLFCNYAPGGNFNNDAVYEEGSACTKCSGELTECKKSLCSSKTDSGKSEDTDDEDNILFQIGK